MRKVAAFLGVLLVAAAAVAGAQAVRYRGEARPGVRVLGTDVGGRSHAEIAAVVRRWLAAPVEVDAGSHRYRVPRGWLLRIDADATAEGALAAGSYVALVRAERIDVRPSIARAAGAHDVLGEIARAGREPVSATVELRGTEPVVTAARDGSTLDRARLVALLERGEVRVRAPFVRIAPAIRNPAARSAAATAHALVSAPIAIEFHGARLGALTPAQLARSVRIRRGVHRFAIVLDRDALARVVRPRLGKWIVQAHNAQFVLAGDRVRVAPSSPGRDVDPARLAGAIATAAHGSRVAHVELAERQPDRTTAKASALGIHTKLTSFTTELGESSSNRIHNVHLMADYIDGTVIRPGEVFSFNDVVGERSPERGFLEGQMIIGALVLPSIGGGVCQTATTLFNDAFETGLPIIDRTNHNLYLSHYPLGRDATVSWGGPDLKFRNDLKHGILIKSSYTDQTLTFAFYGTPEGRRVVSTTSPKTNWQDAKLAYAVDPRAPAGSVHVVSGSGAQGFDVSVARTVYAAGGSTLRKDTFRSRYIPEGSTAVYGPGHTPPGPYFVIPTT